MKLIVRRKLGNYIVYDENNSVIGEWKQSYFKGAKIAHDSQKQFDIFPGSVSILYDSQNFHN